jgi:YD repeat-containing protein
VVRATGSNGTVVTYGYDDAGRLVWTENGDGRTALSWDDAGRIVRLTCGERVVVATYEPPAEGGRVTSLDDSDGTRERYVYQGSAGGLYRSVTVYRLEENAATTDEDEDDGEATSRAPSADERTEPRELRRYTFVEPMTGDGRRWTWQATEEESGDATVTIYDDRTFQPLSVAASDRVARLQYDAFGRIVRKEVEGETTALTYGPEGKVVRVEHRGSAARATESFEVRYAYDAQARLVSAERGEDTVRVGYDDRGRMVSVDAVSSGTVRKLTIQYGDNDRPVRLEVEGIGAVVVEYDAHGDIKRVDSSSGRRVALYVTSAMQALLDLIRPASVKAGVF